MIWGGHIVYSINFSVAHSIGFNSMCHRMCLFLILATQFDGVFWLLLFLYFFSVKCAHCSHCSESDVTQFIALRMFSCCLFFNSIARFPFQWKVIDMPMLGYIYCARIFGIVSRTYANRGFSMLLHFACLFLSARLARIDIQRPIVSISFRPWNA